MIGGGVFFFFENPKEGVWPILHIGGNLIFFQFYLSKGSYTRMFAVYYYTTHVMLQEGESSNTTGQKAGSVFQYGRPTRGGRGSVVCFDPFKLSRCKLQYE